jgi:hypothetical protein
VGDSARFGTNPQKAFAAHHCGQTGLELGAASGELRAPASAANFSGNRDAGAPFLEKGQAGDLP